MRSAKVWASVWIPLVVALHAVPILHNQRQYRRVAIDEDPVGVSRFVVNPAP
jgi:hypothetical protein